MKQLTLENLKIKRCSKCRKNKSKNEFYKNKTTKDKLQKQCKECQRKYYQNNPEQYKKSAKKWRKNNPKYQKEWRKNNPDKIKKHNKKYYQNNKEKILIKQKEWVKNNPKKIKELQRKAKRKYLSTPKNRLNHRISAAIWKSLKQNKEGNHWENLVSYILKELVSHLENQFKPGMSWLNMGKWHIDHIKPISSFNFNSYEDEEFKKCWALSNLQPLWAKENMLKGKNIIKNGEI